MYTSNSPICLLTLVKLRVGDLYVMPLALVYFMKIGALKAMIFFNDVKEICWYYLRIWVKLFTVKVHKMYWVCLSFVKIAAVKAAF